MAAVYYRTNLTMRQLGPLFGRSSSTVCRVIQRLGPLLALEPVSRPADAADRLWIVAGTLAPVRDRKVAACISASQELHRECLGQDSNQRARILSADL